MSEQLPKEKSDTPRTDAAKAIVAQFASDECVELVGELVGQLERELTDLRASLRREENARKVLADENKRLRKRNSELDQHVEHLLDECKDTRRQLAAWVNQS